MGKIIAVCSGSGGVGKTTIALSIAAGAAKTDRKTILLDASGTARSSDLVLGLESVVSLDMIDVITRQTAIEAALYPVSAYDGLYFACASLYDGVAVTELEGVILALQSMCDLLVIDLPTGQALSGSGVMREHDVRLLVLRPDDAGIRAAERLMSSIGEDRARLELAISRCNREWIRQGFQYERDTVAMLLDRPVLGVIPEDVSILAGMLKGKAAIECDGPAWNALSDLLHGLLNSEV